MKYLRLIQALLVTLFFAPLAFAQQSADVQNTMDQIVKKHETTEGVTCMTVAKGSGIEMVKMMFNKEFGKDFMRGVTSITIIDYSDASEQTCMTLREDLNAFIALMKEFDVSKEKQFADNDYIRCFASASDSGILSDFVIALESEDSKMVMYMAGKINTK